MVQEAQVRPHNNHVRPRHWMYKCGGEASGHLYTSSDLQLANMKNVLFYGGLIVFWIGLIGFYACLLKMKKARPGTNYFHFRDLATQGNPLALKGMRLQLVAAIGGLAQVISIFLK